MIEWHRCSNFHWTTAILLPSHATNITVETTSFFGPAPDSKHEQITNVLSVASFNCKNVLNSALTISDLAKQHEIILIQEHWLFNFQLHLLDEVHKDLSGTGKALDDNNPIVPIQKPRGYGGVGVLWNKSLDNVITTLPDGGNRIHVLSSKPRKDRSYLFRFTCHVKERIVILTTSETVSTS